MEIKQIPEGIINEEAILSLKEFCLLCNVDEPYIIEMVEMGILAPEGQTITRWHFSLLQIHRFRKAQRLQNDLKLNLAGVALSLELLDELEQLHNRLQNLEHQLELFGTLRK